MGITGNYRNDLLRIDRVTKKKYTSAHVGAVKGMQDTFGWSVRKIAKETGIPKSVVGRWTKNPEVWKENYRWNVPEDKALSPKQQVALRKFRKKVAAGKKQDPDRYKGLMIHYLDDDTYEAYSG